MLTRLQNRIDSGPDGEEVIIRYGMWGRSAEIERHGKKFHVVLKGKKLQEFRTLEEAEELLKTLR